MIALRYATKRVRSVATHAVRVIMIKHRTGHLNVIYREDAGMAVDMIVKKIIKNYLQRAKMKFFN